MADEDANARVGILNSLIIATVWKVVRKVSRRSTLGSAIPAPMSEFAAICQTADKGSRSTANWKTRLASWTLSRLASINRKLGLAAELARLARLPRTKL